uniref:Uncharacterized protein n=1 Tax=Peronospora matthiolae TaxID=2874970 RepID=A0AAV1UIH3_9STRA
METIMNLSEAQHVTLEKLTALVGHDRVDLIAFQGPDALRARPEAFSNFECRLVDLTGP